MPFINTDRLKLLDSNMILKNIVNSKSLNANTGTL